MALMPGSNPVFGLNTMGGTVALGTKDGLTAPGGSLELQGGSWGRVTGSGQYGGSTKSGFNYYVAGTLFTEDGWRPERDARQLRWSADYFFSQNYNDLLFVSSDTTGLGYFTNFGKTRRDGIEFNVSRVFSHFMVGGNYTFQHVTYQSPQSIDGGSNSANDSAIAGYPDVDDNIEIAPGDFIPQIAKNIGKAYVEYNPTSKLTADLDLIGVGRSFARGNENNLDQQGGLYYLGPGYSAGYVIANLGAHYQVAQGVELFIQVNNALNHHYYTAALLGATSFDNNYNFISRPFPAYTTGPQAGNYPLRNSTFFAPGAPIGVWGGLKFTFGAR
jgi:hypothetical protein